MLKNRMMPLRIGSCLPIINALIFVLLTSLALAETPPKLSGLGKYETPVPYAGQRNWHVTQNLGATGARGWIAGERGDTAASREILIKSVEPGSPADGILQPYDIVLGVGDKPFASDARLAFAEALTRAESHAGKGRLQLLVQRDGRIVKVSIPLPVMGDYSKTTPFSCPKSARIVDHAAAFLVRHMRARGFGGMTGSLNALCLFASNDDRYLDHVRRSAMNMGPRHTITEAGHETWRWGYCNLFLAEYYLATGDKRVLPTIAEYCDRLSQGQCNPGTWGHKIVDDWIPPGYGSMNQSGLVCFLSMIAARQCGVPVDEEALANSIEFYGRYAGWGAVPYGDHPASTAPTSNGKNGSAAVAFYLLGAKPATQWFARLCASTNLQGFEGGHSGNFFNQLWAPLGAALSGRPNIRNFWSRFTSYRDLARRWDGSFVTQPWPHIREGDLGSGNYVRKGPMWSTGAFALSYLVSTRRLAILGRQESVFGANPPEELKPALQLYRKKQFAECITAVESYGSSLNARVKNMAHQLKAICERNLKSIEFTLADMHRRFEAGDLYTLKFQLQALESILAKDDPRLAPYYAAVQDPGNAEVLKYGADYERVASGKGHSGPKGFGTFMPRPDPRHRRALGTLRNLAKNAKGYYREQAQKKLDAIGSPPEEVMLISELKASKKGTPGEIKPVKLTRDFELPDPQKVQELILTWELAGALRVYLNGTKIMDLSVKPSRNSRPTPTVLKPATLELLKPGENTVTARVSSEFNELHTNCKVTATVLQKP